jgi:hypothetical protein
MTENLERQIISLIARDRLDIPISSMSGKLKRRKPKIAKAIDVALDEDSFEGNRVYARVEYEDKDKARTLKEGISAFSKKFPKYGKILDGLIAEKRAYKETHLYFGMNEGCRLTADDYVGVMTDLGFTEGQAVALYQPILDVSRKISRKRDEERRIMIDSTLG